MSVNNEEHPTILGALEAYLPDMVLIGGWVPEFYRRYSGLPWEGRLSRTTEFDLLVGASLPPGNRPTLREILTETGLRPARNEHFPADWVDVLSDQTVVEFLMPSSGPGIRDPVRPVDGQGYLGAIALPHLELLRAFTLTLEVPLENSRIKVRVPTLGAYVVSKALSFSGRPTAMRSAEDKRAKDLVYIHDIMAAGRAATARVESDLSEIAATHQWDHAASEAIERLETPASVIGDAAAMLVARDRISQVAALAGIRGAVVDLRESIIKHFQPN